MVGWHHQLNGHEFEQALGDGERQGSLVCYSPWGWGCKELDMTEQLNNNKKIVLGGLPRCFSGKESACQAGDVGSISRLGRSHGERNGSPLQYSCLRNPMDRGAW